MKKRAADPPANDPEQLSLRYVPLSTVRRWERNPKRHDTPAIAESIWRHGFGDPPKYDSALEALVYGNGRTEALEVGRAEGRQPPRGVLPGLPGAEEDCAFEGPAPSTSSAAGMMSPEVLIAFRAAGWKTSQFLMWVKNRFSLGHYDYHWQHEPCLYGWKPGAAHRWYGGRDQATVLAYPAPSANREHPTMKPIALFEHLVRNSTREGGVVADFFGGSGTAVLAAELAGRTALVAEADPRYADVIRRRWYEATHPEAEPGAWREATPLIAETLVPRVIHSA